MRTLAFVAVLTLAACSPGVGKDPETMMPPIDPSGGVVVVTKPKTFVVSGTAELHSMTLGGDVVEPLAYSDGATIAAFLADHTPLELHMTDDAHFTLPTVPKDSPYYLQRGDEWVVSTHASIDLSRFRVGRPDAEPCNVASTRLVLDAEGLTAWHDGDELQLVSANTGAMVFNLQDYGTENRMQGGSTRIDAMSVRWYGTKQPLIDGTSGDQAIITQLTVKASRSKTYRAVTGAMIPSAFRMSDGASASVAGRFDVAGDDEAIGLRLDPSDARELSADMNPTALYTSAMFYVDAEPFGAEHGHATSTPDLLIMDLGVSDTTPFDVDASFKNPFPASWTLFYQLRDEFRVSLLVEGATEPADVLIALETNDRYASLKAGIAPPRVGPPTQMTLEGKGAFQRMRIDNDTPELAWSAPSVGGADEYGVSVYRVFVAAGRTETERVATFAIDGALRTMRFPPNVLRRGQTYVLIVSAHANAAIERPYDARFPEASAEAITGLITVLDGAQ